MKKRVVNVLFFICSSSVLLNVAFCETPTRDKIPLQVQWQMLPIRELEVTSVLPDENVSWIKATPWQEERYSYNIFKKNEGIFAAWYNAEIEIPISMKDRRIALGFDCINYHAKVYVNRNLAGEHSGLMPFEVDITPYVKAGEKADILIGVDGPLVSVLDLKQMDSSRIYSITRGSELINIMSNTCIYPWQSLDFIGGMYKKIYLISTPLVYLDDTFIITSVSQRSIKVQTVVKNIDSIKHVVSVRNSIFQTDLKSKAQDLSESKSLYIAPGASVVFTVEETWENPQFWWPHSPHLYFLKTALLEDRNVLDTTLTRFGFREITVAGDSIKINGVKAHFKSKGDIKGILADVFYPQENLARTAFSLEQKSGYNVQRAGMRFMDESFLDVADETGMMIYMMSYPENEFLIHALKDERFWRNWKLYLEEFVKKYRNHPSIVLWSVGNEITRASTYRSESLANNLENVFDCVRSLDSTRPVFTDGDYDCNGAADIISGHTSEVLAFGDVGYHPQALYDPSIGERLGYQKRIFIDPNWKGRKPFYISELELTGWEPDSNAFLADETVMVDKQLWQKTKLEKLVMWISGFRWSGLAGFTTWLENSEEAYSPEIVKALSPVIVLVKEYDGQFFSETKVPRTVKVINDLFVPESLILKWEILRSGKVYHQESVPLDIPAGEEKELKVEFQTPLVIKPEDITFHLNLFDKNGQERYEHSFVYTIFPKEDVVIQSVRNDVVLYDKSGLTTKMLINLGLKYRLVNTLQETSTRKSGILLIGTNSLDKGESLAPLKEFVRNGGTIFCFEQDNPAVEGLPIHLVSTNLPSTIFFIRNKTHEMFKGLDSRYTRYWNSSHTVSRNNYFKPTVGNYYTLADCGDRTGLGYTPLLEIPYGSGKYLLCQLELTRNYEQVPAARMLLRNILNYVWNSPGESLVGKGLLIEKEGDFSESLDRVGARYDKVHDVNMPKLSGYSAVFVTGKEKEFEIVNRNAEEIKEYVTGGGILFVQDVTPEAIEALNNLFAVGSITIKPFSATSNVVKNSEDILLNGLTHGDFRWKTGMTGAWSMRGREILSDTILTGVFRETAVLRIPAVNGASAVFDFRENRMLDKVIVYQPELQSPVKLKLEFSNGTFLEENMDVNPRLHEMKLGKIIRFPPRSTSFLKVSIAGDNFINEKVPKTRYFEVAVPGFSGISNTLKIIEPAGIVKFTYGRGSIYLSRFNFGDKRNPDDAKRVLCSMLSNLGIEISGIETAYPTGDCSQVDISTFCNRRLDDDDLANNLKGGWIDEGKNDLRDFPTGVQIMAGILYRIYRGVDNPDPASMILKSHAPIPLVAELPKEITGVRVDQKVDRLFFLQTAAWCENRREIIAKYIVHYENNQIREIPLVSGVNIADWALPNPKDLPEAQLAWTGSTRGDKKVVSVYSMPWLNPLPEVTIKTIDFVSMETRAIPILIAISGMEGGVRSGENMVKNGSFEQLTPDNLPLGWNIINKETINIDTNHAVYGTHSLKMEGKSSNGKQKGVVARQEIEGFKPGKIYTISVTMTTELEDKDSFAYVSMDYVDDAGNRLETSDLKNEELKEKAKTRKIWHNGCFANLDIAQTRMYFTTAVPEDATRMYLVLLLMVGEKGGRAWFDGVMLEPGEKATGYKDVNVGER